MHNGTARPRAAGYPEEAGTTNRAVPPRIGIVGTGFIARGLVLTLEGRPGLAVSRVLTRRDPSACHEFPRPDLLTNSVDDLIDHSDLVVECSGDVIHAAEVIARVMAAGLPVVTMDAEFQVTVGSYFVERGLVTEAEGDQPGCLAALREELVQMGFEPLVYGNIKGFLNPTPTPEAMLFWARKQGISLGQTTAFTDGTKLQIEQALVANGLGAGIAAPGLLGPAAEDLQDGAARLAAEAARLGRPISDYVLSPRAPKGVFIVARADPRQQAALQYFKMGDGPYYTFLRNYHLCHLEIPKTIWRVLRGDGVLLNNGLLPSVGVVAVAKRPLARGTVIQRPIGGFDVRGIAVPLAANRDSVPIGLLSGAVVRHPIEPGQPISLSDVEIPETFALQAWRQIVARLDQGAAAGQAQAVPPEKGEG